MRNTRQNRRIRDLIAVQVQHGKHSSIANRIQKFIRMPRGSQRTALGLTVTHGHSNNEIRIIERGTVGMRDGITQLAAFVNRSGSCRSAVRTDSAGERKLLEEFEQPGLIPTLVG